MPFQAREFQAGPDPFGRSWKVEFVWLQTAISIRHSDSVDVKFLVADGETTEEKVVALPNPLLLELSRSTGPPLTDPGVMRLAALHLKWMIETGEDLEKTLVTMKHDALAGAHAELEGAPAARR